MPPSYDPQVGSEQYDPKRVLFLSLPAAMVLGIISAGMAAFFGMRIPGVSASIYRVADLAVLPALWVLVPLSILTSWHARVYLRRFPTRDFAMNILLAFNFLAWCASLLVFIPLLLFGLWSGG